MKNLKFVLTFWIIFIAGIFTLTMLFYFIAIGKMGYMPEFEELENPKSNLASEVISTDGKILGKFYLENRNNITYLNINSDLRNALR